MKTFILIIGAIVALYFADQHFTSGKNTRSLIQTVAQFKSTIVSKMP